MRSSLLISVVCVALVGLSLGCDGGANGQGGSGTQGTDISQGSQTSQSGQGGTGGQTTATTGSGPTAPNYGSVTAISASAMTAPSTVTLLSQASAGFLKNFSLAPACSLTAVGPCTIEDCQLQNLSVGTHVAAGAVTISGGSHVITMQADGSENYASPIDMTQTLFSGGETLVYQVEGSADVPALQGTLIAPSPVTLLSPDLTQLTIDRTKDIAISWTGGQAGQVDVGFTSTLSAGNVNTEQVVVACKFDVGNGSGTVPSAALSTLFTTAQGAKTFAQGFVVSTTTATAPNWQVGLTAQTLALTPSGTEAAGLATIF